ncbi:MAG: hypothetical protein AAFP19_19280 [Bacteroidota bacterium]
MRPFEASIGTVTQRFFLMMLVILVGGFTGQVWLIVLGLPIFLSALLAISFVPKKSERKQGILSFMKARTKKKAA